MTDRKAKNRRVNKDPFSSFRSNLGTLATKLSGVKSNKIPTSDGDRWSLPREERAPSRTLLMQTGVYCMEYVLYVGRYVGR
jgi:hypothetical protein